MVYTMVYHNNVINAYSISFMAVGSLNNDRTVMSRPFAWRPLACLPILKTSAFTNTSSAWQVHNNILKTMIKYIPWYIL